MAGTPVVLAVSAGMVAAANPCGFAMLPAYLSLLVAGQDSAAGRHAPPPRVQGVGRALVSTAAMTAGFVAVFGAFGLVLAPVAGWLQPRLPWLTLVLGGVLVLLGGWLTAGRSLPGAGAARARAPRLTGSPASMALFGVAYALASLSCTVAPFLAIVVSSLNAGSESEALLLFLAYAGGMGLVVGVTALAVALVRVSMVRRLRRAAAVASRVGGMLLMLAGAYVAYYGWYELRVAADARAADRDLIVDAVASVQQRLVGWINEAGAGLLLAIFGSLLVAAMALRRDDPADPELADPAVPTRPGASVAATATAGTGVGDRRHP